MESVQYFNNIASQWNEVRRKYFEEKLKYKVLSKADINDKVVADLGCGTGFISTELAKKAKLVFSIDNSVNMLSELKNIILEKNITNIYPIKSSLNNVALFDESIDIVTINMALHHIKDAKRAINEMYRVLKKGGIVIISDVMEHDGYWAKKEMFDEWLGFSNEQISEWLTDANFKNINIENTDLRCKGYSSQGEYTEAGIFIAVAVK